MSASPSAKNEGSFSYWLAVLFLTALRKVFFRDVVVRGAHKIPLEGPVIFVAAPHANQFVDPVMLITTCPRPIGFLMAAVSLKRRIVGFFGRLLNSIPVDRAQDYAQMCTGVVGIKNASDPTLITGTETSFLQEILPKLESHQGKLALHVSRNKESFSSPIKEVISATELRLTKPFEGLVTEHLLQNQVKFSVAPIIDQQLLYTSVFKQLEQGKCIGVFPEGGSHDRAEMLPLKAGVTIMALGFESMGTGPGPTAAAGGGKRLKIVPCGLNYFNAHKFRSRAVLEFGDPFEVPEDLVQEFRAGGEDKRRAIGKFLHIIAQSLRAITVNVPDFETLQVIQAARRLYRPENTLRKPDLQIELNRRFVKGYMKFKDDPRIVQLRHSIIAYNNLLQAFGIRDHQVKNTEINTILSACQLVYHLSVLVVFGLVCLPGFAINAPALYCIKRISRSKAAAAKKASSVKIHGKDVISTWKLLVAIVLLPLIYGFYSVVLLLLFFTRGWCWCGWGGVFVLFLVFFYAFMLVSWLTIRLSELFFDSYFAIKPLIISMVNPQRCYILRQVRSSLREQVNLIVNEIGPIVVDDFEQNRIVKPPAVVESWSSGRSTPKAGDGPTAHDAPSPTPPSSSPLLTLGSANFSSSSVLSNDSSSSGLFGGRASPVVFEENMEAIEQMLAKCRESLSKKKLE